MTLPMFSDILSSAYYKQFLHYQDDASKQTKDLYIEKVSLSEVAAVYGTPTYIYAGTHIAQRCEEFRTSFAGIGVDKYLYALKANDHLAIIKVISGEGFGVDVVSGGEIEKAIKAGVSPQDIVFSGVAKTQQELAYALSLGIDSINVESVGELHCLLQHELLTHSKTKIILRLNPQSDPITHSKITTGTQESKFGIHLEQMSEVFALLESSKYRCQGIAIHIGSQMSSIDSWGQAIQQAIEVAQEFQRRKHPTVYLDIGGGFPVPDNSLNDFPTLNDFSACLQTIPHIREFKLRLAPGRYLVARSGVLLSRVIYVKPSPLHTFLIIDAAMNDLLRPSMYNVIHPIVSVRPKVTLQDTPVVYKVVGGVCESSDVFVNAAAMDKVSTGDLVAILNVGAYGYVMASRYNSRPLPNAVMVMDTQHKFIRQSDSVAQVIAQEIMPF